MADAYHVMVYPGPPRFAVVAIGELMRVMSEREGAQCVASGADLGEVRAFRDRLVDELEAEEAKEATDG